MIGDDATLLRDVVARVAASDDERAAERIQQNEASLRYDDTRGNSQVYVTDDERLVRSYTPTHVFMLRPSAEGEEAVRVTGKRLRGVMRVYSSSS